MKVLRCFMLFLFAFSVLAQGEEKDQNNEGIRIKAKLAFEIKADHDSLADCIAKGKAGDFVKIIEKSESGYYYVDYNGHLGYMHSMYIVNPEKQDSFDEEISERMIQESLNAKIHGISATKKDSFKPAKLSANEILSVVNSIKPGDRSMKMLNSRKSINPDDVIERSHDEFTGETLITAEISGPISFVKTITETGKDFIILKWKSYSDKKPDKRQLELILLFDDNSRMSINLPIVCKYDEFWTSFNLSVAMKTETVMDPTMYSLRSEVILTSSQISILKNKNIKKYRLEGYSANTIYYGDVDSKIIFSKLLTTK